jgi:HK97 family phage prohead protease
MKEIKRFKAGLSIPEGGPEGSVKALFSVFNMRDEDGDVTLPSFFSEGQELAMAPWGHNWGDLPPGRGQVKVAPEGAVFDGFFFTDTANGREHWLTVKHMGSLQQWSFGFKVLEADMGEFGGLPCRFLKRGEVYEVSPVLIGANRQTYTLDVKSGGKGAISYEKAHESGTEKAGEDTEWDGSAALKDAETEEELVRMHAWRDPEGDPEAKSSYKLPHHKADGTLVWAAVKGCAKALGSADIPEGDVAGVKKHLAKHYEEFDQAPPWEEKGLTYMAEGDRVLASVKAFAGRSGSLAELRRKEGRVLSDANRKRLVSLHEQLVTVAADIDDLLKATERNTEGAGKGADIQRLYLEYQRTIARLQGVQA